MSPYAINADVHLPYSELFSPDANQIVRKITTPADKYTGALNVQIPIFTMETNCSQIPIEINYNTSGVKVDDIASIVGLGWGLNAGGRISRSVKGEPDNSSQLKQSGDIYTWKNDTPKYYYDNKWDTQPDICYFECPGLSGSFVYDAKQEQCISIPYQNIKIEFANNIFTIYDSSGNKYVFGTTEATKETFLGDNDRRTREYVSSWYLDSIEHLNGARVVFYYNVGSNYSYKNENFITKFLVRAKNA